MAHSYTSRFTQLPAAPTPRYPYNSSSTTQAQTSQQSSRYHRPQPPAVPSYKTHIYSPSDYSTPGLSPSLPPSRPHSLHLRRSQEPEQREQRERKRDSRSSRENLHSSVSVKDLPDLGEVDLMDGKNATRPTRFIASIACPPRRRPSEEQTSRRTSGPATDSGSGSDNSKVTKRKDRRSGTDSTPSP